MKRGINIVLFVLLSIASLALTRPCLAEVPEELQGTWVVDPDVTLKAIKRNPALTPEELKMAPTMLRFMTGMSMTFTTDSIIHRMQGEEMTIRVKMQSSRPGHHVFKATHEGETQTMTARVGKGTRGMLNLRSKGSDEMDYVIWKRGEIPSADAAAQQQAEAMGEIMATAIQESLTEGLQQGLEDATAEEAPSSEVPVVPYEFKWGKLTINALTDEALAEITAMEAEQRSKVTVGETCSQADFDKLAQIQGITDLTVQRNPHIGSIVAVVGMADLTRLKLENLERSGETPIDLGPLAALVNLEVLDCYATRVANTEALAGLSKLRKISFYMSAVSSLTFLASTPNVEALDLYGFAHTFEDYTPLQSLAKIKELDIYMNTQATDAKLAPLAALTSLESISMANCREVATMAFVGGAENLKEVKAKWANKLMDISALADKASLEVIDLEDTVVTDFTPLTGKLALKDLDLSGTAFADLSILSQSTELESLDISETQVSDITPLAAFTKLRDVSVPASIPDGQIEALKQALPELDVSKDG